MWQLFIVTCFDWWEIQFGQIWNKTVISILSVNVATFYSNMFWLVRNPVWTDLKSNSHFYPICKCEKKLETFFDLWEIQFDQVWTSLSILDRCFDLSINKLNIHCQKIESCNLSIIETQNIQLLVITSASDLWDHLIFCWSQAEEGKNSKKISYKNSLINMNHFQLALKKGA